MLANEDMARVESEAGIIATLIHHPDFSYYSEQLLPNHFTNEENRYIYQAICSLARDGIERIDPYAYYSIEVYNADNQKVDPGKLIVTDMAAPTNLDNGLYAALVTGSRPMLTYSIEEKTSLQELHYNNMPITISGDTVTIGKLVFTRSVSGVVTDVHFDGNILELTKELTALNMTPEDVYNGKVCMSNDVLIQNFGMICKQTATSKWYNDADAIKNITIPKTGDAPLNALFVALVTLVTTGVAICFSCRFKQKKD